MGFSFIFMFPTVAMLFTKWLSYYADRPLSCCFFPADMLESNNLVTFEGMANSSAYHTFLLDEERGRLLVGAKDHIFSFNLLNVSKDYAQVKLMFVFFSLSVCLVVFIHSSILTLTVSLFTFLTDISVHLHPECQSGTQVSRDLLLCFDTKVPHEYFRARLLHTITRCARHVRCSLHTWMNNGVNWNKVDNKSHCDLFNPHIQACMHTSCTCVDSLRKTDPGTGWSFSKI